MKRLTLLAVALGIIVSSAVLMTGEESYAKRPTTPPTTSTFGSLRLWPQVGSCADTTTSALIILSNGFPRTQYTVSAAGATSTFTTDQTGYGSIEASVPTPLYEPETVNIIITANGQSQSTLTELYCTPTNA